MIMINNAFELGEIVYLKTDIEQKPRMVCSVQAFLEGEVLYHLISGTYTSSHYAMEITRDKPVF